MKFALVPLAITLASASPVWNNVAKRQASSVASEASSAIASATSAIASASEAASSAVSSAVAVPSSAASSAVASSAVASSAVASASASAVPEYEVLYPCPAGTELVYVEEQQTYPGVTVAQATPFIGFSNSTWYGVVNGTGEDIGATRNVQFPGVPIVISEALVNTTTDPTTGAVQQVFNGTTPLNTTGVVLASYSTVFQFYDNTTETGSATGKLFTNACVAPAAVQSTLASLFQAALAALGTTVAAGTVSASASATVASGLSSVIASASESASSAVEVTSSAASAASAVSSAAASVAESLTSAAAAVTSA